MVWWATYVLKERADVGGNEQHVSVHFHIKDAPVSLSLSLSSRTGSSKETPRRRQMTHVWGLPEAATSLGSSGRAYCGRRWPGSRLSALKVQRHVQWDESSVAPGRTWSWMAGVCRSSWFAGATLMSIASSRGGGLVVSWDLRLLPVNWTSSWLKRT